MRIIIHRGIHEIGGTCIEVEAGGTRIILDVGMPLFDGDFVPWTSESCDGRVGNN